MKMIIVENGSETKKLTAEELRQEQLILEAQRLFTPEIVAKIAANELPECFTPERTSYVAMARLLLVALTTVEELLQKIPRQS